MPHTYRELPAIQRNYVQQVHEALARFNCGATEAIPDALAERGDDMFPDWDYRTTYFYSLSNAKATPLFVPSFRADRHMLLWLSPNEACDVRAYEAGPLTEAGFALIGMDRGGNYVAIDTTSVSGLEIAMVDYGSVASNEEVTERATLRTGKNVEEFLRWVYQRPADFDSAWKQHYSA